MEQFLPPKDTQLSSHLLGRIILDRSASKAEGQYLQDHEEAPSNSLLPCNPELSQAIKDVIKAVNEAPPCLPNGGDYVERSSRFPDRRLSLEMQMKQNWVRRHVYRDLGMSTGKRSTKNLQKP